MYYLRNKYKNDGYAVWFLLLEELGKADYHFLDLSDKKTLMYLSASFMVEEAVLNDIIEILVEFEKFDKELWSNHSIILSVEFLESIQDAYKKRNNDCIDKNTLVLLLKSKGKLIGHKSTPNDDKSTTKGSGNTQTKVKDSKGEESKDTKETSVSLDFVKLLEYINKTFNRKFKMITPKVKLKYQARVKEGFTNLDIKTAIDNVKLNTYHIENNYQYCTTEFFSRSETLEKYGQKLEKVSTGPQNTLILGKHDS